MITSEGTFLCQEGILYSYGREGGFLCPRREIVRLWARGHHLAGTLCLVPLLSLFCEWLRTLCSFSSSDYGVVDEYAKSPPCHTCAVLSVLAEAMRWPSGDQASA